MKELALHDENNIRNSIMLRFESMESLARKLAVREFRNMDEMFEDMPKIVKSIPSADKVSFLDSERTQYVSNRLITEESYLADLCEGRTGRFVVRLNTSSYLPELMREVLFMAVPVSFEVSGHRMEWMIAQFPISTIEQELKISSYNNQGYSSVIDMDGNYIINMSRTHNFLALNNFFSDLSDAEIDGHAGIDEIRTAAATSAAEASSVIYTKDGQKNIMVIQAMDFADWYFVTTVPTAVFSAQTNAITSRFMTLLGIIAVILIGVFLLFLRQRRQQEDLRVAEAASRSKTEFLFNMSHDIRTPMNAILGYTDIGLRHIGDPERSKDSFEKIRNAGGHLLSLINDILEMGRIESGKMELFENPMDVRQSTKAIEQISQSLAMSKDIEFTTVVGEITNPYVYADELHINEVLINLISNAVKYTPEGGCVQYRISQIGDVADGKVTLRFEISDNGIGMSEEFQRHLFESFSREETTTVSRIEGTGLGLSIVKRIVDMSGGSIRVTSVQKKGTTVTVEIPFRVMDESAVKAFEAETAPQEAAADDLSLAGCRVLLVEDNEMNREIASDLLTENGLEVEEAEDGELTLKAIREKGVNYYDFILMDIQMPVMNGYDAAKAIRAMYPDSDIPIIAVSANAFEEDRRLSLESGMNEHLAKPVDIRLLNKTLEKYRRK